MLTKQDYVSLALLLGTAIAERKNAKAIAARMATWLQVDNPRFDRERFFNAMIDAEESITSKRLI